MFGWLFKKDKKRKQEEELLKNLIEKLKQKELKDWSVNWSGRGDRYATHIDNFTFGLARYGDGDTSNIFTRLRIWEGEKLISEVTHRSRRSGLYEDGGKISESEWREIEKLFDGIYRQVEEIPRIKSEKAMMEQRRQEEEVRQSSLDRLKRLL